jgi:hypothetical protein
MFLCTVPFAWSQLEFSAIPVSIYADFKVAKWAVSSLTQCSNPFQVNIFISRFMKQILHNFQNVQEGKGHQKKETQQIFKVPNLCGYH